MSQWYKLVGQSKTFTFEDCDNYFMTDSRVTFYKNGSMKHWKVLLDQLNNHRDDGKETREPTMRIALEWLKDYDKMKSKQK